MKRVLLALLLMTSTARADEESGPRSMRITGAVLLALGAVLSIPSMAFLGGGFECQVNWTEACGDVGGAIAYAMGSGLALVAFAHVAVGIPLVAVGEHRLDRIRGRISLAPTVSPGGAGASLAMTW